VTTNKIKEEERNRRDAYRKIEWETKQKFRTNLELHFGTSNNPKRDTLWELAWSYGHSSGYQEVENYYIEMLPLIQGERNLI
jgi:hypothetical protein